MIFTAYSLASSSKGNSIYIRIGDDELLIDAGISLKRITDSLSYIGTSIERIKAVFITHEHSDHTSALTSLAKKYDIKIHFTEPSASAYLKTAKNLLIKDRIVVHPPVYNEKVGEITVRSFVTPHDSEGSVGFIITDGTPEHSVAVATDMGEVDSSVSEALIGVENVFLESNHDENMLLCGSYPYALKRRILSKRGHLSNEAAAEFAAKLAHSGTKHIMLAHLSPENNLPELALETVKPLLADCDTTVAVADMSKPTRLI